MPVPKPNAGEEQDEFISRCIGTLSREDPDRDPKQVQAICFDAWRTKEHTEKLNPNAHSDFIQFFQDFLNIYGDEQGEQVYNAMVKSYNLDETQSYGSQITRECLSGMCESYRWTKPLIQYLRDDETSKYYKVRALTASLSANKNDYRDIVELERSARTMAGRPLNINHDHSKTLPFPDNKVVWAEYEDKAVEAVIKIHNNQKDIQDKLDNGLIVNPSIEGDPLGGYPTAEGRAPVWYNFTALALLEKDVTLPGVPSTYGFTPLFVNESLGRSLVESLSMEKKQTDEKEMTKPEEVDLREIPTPLSEQGVQGMDVCGQCKFYMELSNTTTEKPAAPGSAAIVTHSAGAIGPGVGRCSITEGFVRKADPVCTDGRLREQPTDLDRTIETMRETNMKSEIADLKTQLLEAHQATNTEREGRIRALQDVVEKDTKIADLARHNSLNTTELQRIKEDRVSLREKLDKVKEDNTRLTIQRDSALKDVELYKDENKRLESSVDKLTQITATLREDVATNITKVNDESTKRAEAIQRAINSEADKARAIEDLAISTAEVASRTRELSDLSLRLNEYAKKQLADASTIDEWRKKHSTLTEEYRELKRLYNKLKDQRKIKVNVKT